MNKTKNSKIVLVLSVFLIFLIIGSASAAEDRDEIGNETISAPITGVDTVTNTVDQDSVSAAETVNNGGDDTDNELLSATDDNILSANIGSFKDLDELIKSSTGTLTLSKDYTYNSGTDSEYIDGIIINKTICIDGAGHTIDANKKARIFKINGNNVTLTNITFINGYHSKVDDTVYRGSGGSIQWIADFGKITYCNFFNSTDYHSGANGAGSLAIYSLNFTCDNCVFINSTSLVSGGAINFIPTINDFNPSKPNGRVTNCYFENCHSTHNGGALEAFTANGYYENLTFIHCYTTVGMGGAVMAYDNAPNSTFVNCIFINNTAYSTGGGLGVQSRNVENLTIINCTFINNNARYGGGVYFIGQYSKIINSTFINNHASTGGAVLFNAANCQLIDCNFTNNTAIEGGAVKFNADNSYMGFCNYINNSATRDGGALCANAQNSTVENCTFTNNTAPSGKDFFAHGTYTINFIGLKFDTLYLTNNNYTYSVEDGYGTNYQRPAAWLDSKTFFDSFLDTSHGKATIYPPHI